MGVTASRRYDLIRVFNKNIGRKIDHQRDAGKILEHNPRDNEGNFRVRRRPRIPVGEILNVFSANLSAVAISEDRFEDNSDADRQP